MDWLWKRLREPSSLAGLGVLATGILQIIGGDVAGGATAAAAGVGAFMVKEKGDR